MLQQKQDKRVVQKTAEATGDLIGNEIADKITSVGKSKNEQKCKRFRYFNANVQFA